jgi:alkaline phosphatase D
MPLAPASLLLMAISFPGTTLDQGSASPLTRIAFGSCADEEKPQPIWDVVLIYRPELFLFAGDNLYGDRRDGQDVMDDAD